MRLRNIFNIINGGDQKISFNTFDGAEEREFDKLENFAIFKVQNLLACPRNTKWLWE